MSIFNFATRKVGGIRFVKLGRFCLAFAISREFRPFPDVRPPADVRPLRIDFRRAALMSMAGAMLVTGTVSRPVKAADLVVFQPAHIARMAEVKAPSPAFWLVEVDPATRATRFVEGHGTAYACYQATFTHDTLVPGGFATCLATRPDDERSLARAVVDYGRTACERADLAPTDSNVEACLASAL